MHDRDDWIVALASGDPRADEVATAFQHRAMHWRTYGIAPHHLYTWYEDGVLSTALDIDDDERRVIIRTLRADFDGDRVLVGIDISGPETAPLVEGLRGVSGYDVGDETPEAIGAFMAGLLEPEVGRAIYREEWDRNRFTRWVLDGGGTELVWSSLTNDRPEPMGNPQRRVQVRGPFIELAAEFNCG